MMTAFHIIKFIFKIFLLIILLPFIIIWLCLVYAKYKYFLIKNLVESGMPKDMAKEIAKETKPSKMLDFKQYSH